MLYGNLVEFTARERLDELRRAAEHHRRVQEVLAARQVVSKWRSVRKTCPEISVTTVYSFTNKPKVVSNA